MIRVAVEMRGLGLVAVLFCVALVLGIVTMPLPRTLFYWGNICICAGQSETGKKPSKGKLLSPPVPRKCSASEKHFYIFFCKWEPLSYWLNLHWSFVAGPKRFKYQGHNYFYSGDVAPYKKIKYDWLDGRNFCRWEKEEEQFSDFDQSGNTVWTWFPWRPSRKMTTFKTGWTHATLRILGLLEGEPTFSFPRLSSYCDTNTATFDPQFRRQALWLWRLWPTRLAAHQCQGVVLDGVQQEDCTNQQN